MNGKLAKYLRKMHLEMTKNSKVKKGEYFYDEHFNRITHPYQRAYRRLKRYVITRVPQDV
jgi:hypothetical protein